MVGWMPARLDLGRRYGSESWGAVGEVALVWGTCRVGGERVASRGLQGAVFPKGLEGGLFGVGFGQAV